MEQHLFNVAEQFTWIKDLLLDKGPIYLEDGATVLDKIAAGFRTAAGYIRMVGPMIQFAPAGDTTHGAHPLSQEASAQLGRLEAIRNELQAELDKTGPLATPHKEQIQKQLKAGVNAGLLDWAGKVDPETKAALLSLAVSILNKFLAKAGLGGLIAAPSAVPASGTHRAGKTEK